MIASGGYVTAALADSHDIYIWGGRMNGEKVLGQLSGLPTPIDLFGKDIMDVGVGMDHLMALTTDGKLFVIGTGKKGQLGGETASATDWTEISLPLEASQHIIGVTAGYKNSFALVGELAR